MPKSPSLARGLIRWQRRYGRHGLPWQQQAGAANPQAAYAVWVSEIMLQQTQVATVIPYYHRFMRRFPNVQILARARTDSVFSLWQGLGYYARARHLHAAAKQIYKHGFPTTIEGWRALPGVGASTAAAIMVFAYGERHAILDGNVKRVFARVSALPYSIKSSDGLAQLWEVAESHLPPKKDIAPYTQGLMDLGNSVCLARQPRCSECPLTAHCAAYQQQSVHRYPMTTPAAAKPTRHKYMLLIYDSNNDAILLCKRPPKGIWSNLWAFPEDESQATLHNEYRALLANRAADKTLTMHHTFTHYHLQASIAIYHLPACRRALPAAKWINRQQLTTIALPAPVRRVVESFLAEEDAGLGGAG